MGEDPYLQFMPVPAVPNPATDSQASRQPKDSLNTVDLNLNLPNRLDLKPPQVFSLGSPTNPTATLQSPFSPPLMKRRRFEGSSSAAMAGVSKRSVCLWATSTTTTSVSIIARNIVTSETDIKS